MAKSSVPTSKPLSLLEFFQQSYTDRLAEEQLAEVQQIQSNWDVSISKTKASIARAKRNLSDALRTGNLDLIIDAKNQLSAYESGLAVALEYYPQLFPTVAE